MSLYCECTHSTVDHAFDTECNSRRCIVCECKVFKISHLQLNITKAKVSKMKMAVGGERYCGCAHPRWQHASDLQWKPTHCLVATCKCISFLEVQVNITTDKGGVMKTSKGGAMQVDNELPPCPFCAWDANNKAQIRMALVVSECPCTQRGTSGEKKYLEAVVYHFGEKLGKLLENFDWAALQKLRKQSP